jgi:hypothetical protein
MIREKDSPEDAWDYLRGDLRQRNVKWPLFRAGKDCRLLGGGEGFETVDAPFHFSGAAAFVGEAAEGVVEEAMHLLGGDGKCSVYVGGFAGCYERPVVLRANFKQAAGFDWAAVGRAKVFAGQVHVDAREVGLESLEDVVDVGADGVGEAVLHCDGVVAVDLNLHGVSLGRPSLKTLAGGCGVARKNLCFARDYFPKRVKIAGLSGQD